MWGRRATDAEDQYGFDHGLDKLNAKMLEEGHVPPGEHADVGAPPGRPERCNPPIIDPSNVAGG